MERVYLSLLPENVQFFFSIKQIFNTVIRFNDTYIHKILVDTYINL